MIAGKGLAAPKTGKKRAARMQYECSLRAKPECSKVQTLTFKTDYRTLPPLARTSKLYFALRERHQTMENVHGTKRRNYGVAGTSNYTRPSRIGRGVHQLRSTLALIVQWLQLLLRHGWVGESGGTAKPPVQDVLRTAWRRFLEYRERTALNRPYAKFTLEALDERRDARVIIDLRGSPPAAGP